MLKEANFHTLRSFFSLIILFSSKFFIIFDPISLTTFKISAWISEVSSVYFSHLPLLKIDQNSSLILGQEKVTLSYNHVKKYLTYTDWIKKKMIEMIVLVDLWRILIERSCEKVDNRSIYYSPHYQIF